MSSSEELFLDPDEVEAAAYREALAAIKQGKLSIPGDVTPDTMLRLGDAAALAFPDGSISAAALRREAAAGRLAIYPIANKHFTTLSDIEEMKKGCRVQAKAHGSSSKKQRTGNGSGSSATVSEPSALDALKATAKVRSESLPPTSRKSTTPEQAAAAVIPMPSKSPTRSTST